MKHDAPAAKTLLDLSSNNGPSAALAGGFCIAHTGGMFTRDSLVESALLGITAGGTGAALALLLRVGVDAEPVFALAGALIGAAGTVAGAVWLTDRNSAAERRAEVRLLDEAYQPLLTAAQTANAIVPRPGEPWPKGFASSLHKLEPTAREAEAISSEALAHAKVINFRQRVRIRHLLAALGSFRSFYNDAFGEREMDPMDEREWGLELDYLLRMTQDALAAFGSHTKGAGTSITIADDAE